MFSPEPDYDYDPDCSIYGWELRYREIKNQRSKTKTQQLENKGKTMTDKTLYEINLTSGTVFGHKLAVNSQGMWVMEVKGTGQVIAVDKETVSKVLPYTIAIKYTEGGTAYHYVANADDGWKVDDFAICMPYGSGGYQLARIVGIDTKSEKATTEFSPIKRIV
jgi:hypothetical protein